MVGSPNFHLYGYLDHEGQIEALINNKEVLMVLHLGPRFSADLHSGRSARVQVIIDGRNSNTALLLVGYLRSIVSDFNQRWAEDNGRPTPPATVRVRP